MYDIHDIHVAANKNILNETDWFSINTHDSHVAYISYTSYVIYFTILTSLEKKTPYNKFWYVSRERNGEWKRTGQINKWTQKKRRPGSECQIWLLHQPTWHYLHGSYLWLNRIICNAQKNQQKYIYNVEYIIFMNEMLHSTKMVVN